MAAFCGGAVCSNRVQIWLLIPEDDGIADPCPRCLEALGAVLGVATDEPLTLASLDTAIGGKR